MFMQLSARLSMRALVLFALLACSLVRMTRGATTRTHDDPKVKPVMISMDDLVVPLGYPLEKYQVQTEDGYILTVHRIPHGRKSTAPSKKLPVILMHGLGGTAAFFAFSAAGLAFQMADEGYDVWLPNTRGGFYSRGHVKLDPLKDGRQYFDFSFQEQGVYDLPAFIDFILKHTSRDALYYVGHSQGATTLLILASTRPEYNAKVKAATLMGPVAYINHVKGLFRVLDMFSGILGYMKNRGYHGIPPVSSTQGSLFDQVCGGWGARHICYPIIESIVGFNPHHMNMSVLKTVGKAGSGGLSLKELQHYSQLIRNGGKFSMFDYGKMENMRRYGEPFPPDFNLTKLTIPTLTIFARNDYVANVPDVMRLCSEVLSSTLEEVADPFFNHLDFIWGNYPRTTVYEKIFVYFDKYW